MTRRKIFITEYDKKRLEELIASAEDSGNDKGKNLVTLAEELARAQVLPSKDIPPDVVTMNSKVRLRDMTNSEEMTYSLVFPNDANFAAGSVSILAPVGTAILGYKQGAVIEWPVPDGIRQLKIEEIVYQPEASGNFSL